MSCGAFLLYNLLTLQTEVFARIVRWTRLILLFEKTKPIQTEAPTVGNFTNTTFQSSFKPVVRSLTAALALGYTKVEENSKIFSGEAKLYIKG
jgi:hypothetical protein